MIRRRVLYTLRPHGKLPDDFIGIVLVTRVVVAEFGFPLCHLLDQKPFDSERITRQKMISPVYKSRNVKVMELSSKTASI